MVSCIILAAGLSSRFGSPKALVEIDGDPLILRLQKQVLSSHVSELIIVLGANRSAITPFILNHKKLKVVYNKDYKLGQTHSFKVGLGVLQPSVQGVMLLPVDCPLITTEFLNGLVSVFITQQPYILVPTYKGKKGHPPLFHGCAKEEILKLPDDVGLNVFEHNNTHRTLFFPVEDERCLISFNTLSEWEEIKKKFFTQR